MISLPDFIITPLVSAAIAILVGLKAAGLRARSHARWLLAVDILFLFPALIPTAIVAGVLRPALTGFSGDSAWLSLLIAIAIVSAPLAYLPARIVLCRVNREYRDTIRLLGLSTIQRSLHLELPLAWPAMALGALLALTRVSGELFTAICPVDRVTPLYVIPFVLALVSGIFLACWIDHSPPHADR